MNTIIYIVGLVVIIGVILSYFVFRLSLKQLATSLRRASGFACGCYGLGLPGTYYIQAVCAIGRIRTGINSYTFNSNHPAIIQQ